MSTSIVARGKIRRAVRLGESIPADWALDASGRPTTDPNAAMEGTLLPVGGPKGYGMAFFIDLVSGLLSGSEYSRGVTTFHKPIRPTGVGVTCVAIDVNRFMPGERFNELVTAHVAAIRDSPKAVDADSIYLPGEIESGRMADALENGVELDDSVRVALEKLIAARGLNLTLDHVRT